MLYVGDSIQIREYLERERPRNFLLIDDGEISDEITFPKSWRVTRLDLAHHTLNPIAKLDYPARRAFIKVIEAAFLGGDATLTKASGLSFIRRRLKDKPDTLEALVPEPPTKAPPGHIWAYEKMDELLDSPVLKRFLCNPTTLSFKGVLIARLNRSELTDFDAFVLGNLLISQYQGTVIIPDYGFYACGFHKTMIREGRLIAGIRFLDEVPELRNHLLQMDRDGRGCLFDDAQVLADFAGLERGTNGYQDEVRRLMGR